MALQQQQQQQQSTTQSNIIGNVYHPTAMLTLATSSNQNLNVITAPIVVDFSNFTVNCVVDRGGDK